MDSASTNIKITMRATAMVRSACGVTNHCRRKHNNFGFSLGFVQYMFIIDTRIFPEPNHTEIYFQVWFWKSVLNYGHFQYQNCNLLSNLFSSQVPNLVLIALIEPTSFLDQREVQLPKRNKMLMILYLKSFLMMKIR